LQFVNKYLTEKCAVKKLNELTTVMFRTTPSKWNTRNI